MSKFNNQVVARMFGRVQYACVIHFPCNPNPPRACLVAHTLPMGSKAVWKNARSVCFICLAIKATWKIPAVDISGILFQTTCNVWTRCNLLPSPWGRAGERAFSKLRQPFPIPQPLKIQALRLVALSLTLSHGREDGAAVGVKGSARKMGCAGCFLLFRRPL